MLFEATIDGANEPRSLEIGVMGDHRHVADERVQGFRYVRDLRRGIDIRLGDARKPLNEG